MATPAPHRHSRESGNPEVSRRITVSLTEPADTGSNPGNRQLNQAAADSNLGACQLNRATRGGNPGNRKLNRAAAAATRRPPTERAAASGNPGALPSFPRKRESRGFAANNRFLPLDPVDSRFRGNDGEYVCTARQPRHPTTEPGGRRRQPRQPTTDRATMDANPGNRQLNRAATGGNPNARQPNRPATSGNPSAPPSFPRKRESRGFALSRERRESTRQ